ncbi:MAG TPA: carbon starvation protein A, partial [Clostridium sp.]|nr:carbon starvation protein A [Clostridium sp.]
CIMFEALFILTTIDAGTRIGRYLLQDLFGKIYKPFSKRNSWANIVFFSVLMSFTWGYLLYTGNVSTIWPMFGTANQMLAAIAFAIGTTIIIKMKKQKYAMITIIPMVAISIITITAAISNVFGNYLPKGEMLLAVLSIVLLVLLVIIIYESVKVWIRDLKNIKAANKDTVI